MKKLALLFAVAGVACLGVLALRALPVRAAPQVLVETLPAPVVVPDVVLPPAPAVRVENHAAEEAHANIEAYTLEIMNSWTPASKSVPTVDYRDVANSIANVTESPDDADLLAAIGYWEGARYAAYVDDGSCNNPAWRKTPEGVRLMHIGGDCDHSHAHSLWQIHPVEDKDAPTYKFCSLAAIESREGAAKCALEIAHRSLNGTGTLAWYTGEWDGPHPKADERLEFAKRARAKHPFHVAKATGVE
jgi:hypothetical protein